MADNDTPEGRARNRRVDLVILNNYALAKTEPASAHAGEVDPGRGCEEYPSRESHGAVARPA